MSLSALSASDERSLYAALELGKNGWLSAIQFPGRDNPGLHPIEGGDAEGQVASSIGLAPGPYDSGESRRSQGISKAGNGLVRHVMIQSAWLWLGHRPNSALTQWFHRRTEGQSKRMRCVMIVALARKLAIAPWRYLETGLIPQGATLSAK